MKIGNYFSPCFRYFDSQWAKKFNTTATCFAGVPSYIHKAYNDNDNLIAASEVLLNVLALPQDSINEWFESFPLNQSIKVLVDEISLFAAN